MAFGYSLSAVALVSVCLLLFAAPGSSQHASCKLKWTFNTDCGTLNTYLVAQLKNFSAPNVAESNYTFISANDGMIKALHTTPVHFYVDELQFTLKAGSSQNTCNVAGVSTSTPISIYDFSTNYCNMFNLLRELPSSIQVSESVSVLTCPFHDKTMCDKYKK